MDQCFSVALGEGAPTYPNMEKILVPWGGCGGARGGRLRSANAVESTEGRWGTKCAGGTTTPSHILMSLFPPKRASRDTLLCFNVSVTFY